MRQVWELFQNIGKDSRARTLRVESLIMAPKSDLVAEVL
jgi:hypothetical protein